MKLPRFSQRLRRLMALLLTVIVLCLVALFWHIPSRWASIRTLKLATPIQLDSVVEKGVVLRLQDGSWIAIRYNDSHAPWGDSYAVARSSDGEWFDHTYHYCGAFRGYRNARKRLRDELDANSQSPESLSLVQQETTMRGSIRSALWRAEQAASLQEAKDALLSMGFQPR